jgi:hypothetical protein
VLLPIGVLATVLLVFAAPVVIAPSLVAAPARASDGAVMINGRSYPRSSGCVTIRRLPERLRVVNNSGASARVYLLPACRGGVTSVVDAGRSATPFGASVFVG